MALLGSLSKRSFYGNTHTHWIEWTATQNKVANTSTITAYFKSTWGGGFGTYSESSGINYINLDGTITYGPAYNGSVGTHTQFTATKTITHKSDGTATFTLGGRHRINSSHADYIFWSNTTFTLDKIPRTSNVGTITGSTIGSLVTVSIDRADNAFSHKYSVRFPNTSTTKISTTDVPVGTSSFSFTPALDWCNNIPNSASGTCYIYLDTYSGATKLGTVTKSFTLNAPASVRPTISNVTVEEANTAVNAVTFSLVQTMSKAKINVTASGTYGSTITGYEIKTNGQTLTANNSTTSTLNTSGTNSLTVTVTDSRGRKSLLYSTSYNVLAYSNPAITSFTAERRSSPTTTIDVVVKGTWSTLSGVNAASYTLKENNVGLTISPSAGYTGTLQQTYTRTSRSNASSFTYEFTITDDFGKSATATVIVGTTFVELSIKAGEGIGVGKVHQQGALDVNGVSMLGGHVFVGGTLYVQNLPVPKIRHYTVTATVPASTYLASTGMYRSLLTISNPYGYVPTIILVTKQTSSGNSIMIDVNDKTTTTIDLALTRATTFGEHSQTFGVVFIG